MALTLNGSDPTGDLGDLLDAKLPIAGGKILQIVRATDTTNRTTTSASAVDVNGMSVTITPQKSDSAILIISNLRAQQSAVSGTPSTPQIVITITDSSNNTISGGQEQTHFMTTASTTTTTIGSALTLIGYATPATTSPVTYKLRFFVAGGSGTASIMNGSNTGQMYAIEVSA